MKHKNRHKMWTDSIHIHHIFTITLIFLQISEVYCIRKCCRKSAQLAENGTYCIRSSGVSTKSRDFYEEDEVLHDSTYWLPKILYSPGMKVTYGGPLCLENNIILRLINDTNIDIIENETLIIRSKNSENKRSFSNESYCVDFIEGSMGPHVIKICACTEVTCIDKCCPKGQILDFHNNTAKCVHNDTYRLPHHFLGQLDKPVMYKHPNHFFCEPGKILLVQRVPRRPFHLKDLQGIVKTFSEERKCLDSVNGANKMLTCSRSTVLQGVEYLSRSLSVVVAVCLMLTLSALWSLSELRGTTHGRVLMCHVFSLTMVNTLRAASYLFGDRPDECLNFAFSVYFFLIAANVWVNVLSLDMADGLRRPLHERALGDTGRWKRTIFFSVYAWGFAAVLTGVAVHAEFSTESTLPKPTYQETRTCRFGDCGYLGRKATLIYYYGPMGTLFLVNLFIYAYLAIRLHRLNLDSEMVDGQAINDSVPAHRSEAIFFRLLMMMGTIEWVVEIIMWGLRGKYRTTEYLSKYKRFATLEDEQESQEVFRIAGVTLDLLRVVSVAWVCCGRPRVRKRLGESVRRTLRRPLRLASAFSSSAQHASTSSDAEAEDEVDADPAAGNRAFRFLRRSMWRLRSWPQRVKPVPPVGRSLSEEPASTSVPITAPASDFVCGSDVVCGSDPASESSSTSGSTSDPTLDLASDPAPTDPAFTSILESTPASNSISDAAPESGPASASTPASAPAVAPVSAPPAALASVCPVPTSSSAPTSSPVSASAPASSAVPAPPSAPSSASNPIFDPTSDSAIDPAPAADPTFTSTPTSTSTVNVTTIPTSASVPTSGPSSDPLTTLASSSEPIEMFTFSASSEEEKSPPSLDPRCDVML